MPGSGRADIPCEDDARVATFASRLLNQLLWRAMGVNDGVTASPNIPLWLRYSLQALDSINPFSPDGAGKQGDYFIRRG
jgi:hypothetical protein